MEVRGALGIAAGGAWLGAWLGWLGGPGKDS